MSTTTQQPIEFTKIKHDSNGNPRYVCSWLYFGTKTYAEAIKLAHAIGGRKYHTKAFGGGIVFSSFNPKLEEKLIHEIAAKQTQETN